MPVGAGETKKESARRLGEEGWVSVGTSVLLKGAINHNLLKGEVGR